MSLITTVFWPYQFTFGGAVIAEPDPDYSAGELFGEEGTWPGPIKTLVGTVFDARNKGVYQYGFGDSWRHEIVVEKAFKETKGNYMPIPSAAILATIKPSASSNGTKSTGNELKAEISPSAWK